MSAFYSPDVLGPPPGRLKGAQITAWNDIVAACAKGVLIRADRLHVECTAMELAQARSKGKDFDEDRLGLLHKCLAQMFLKAEDRAKLGIPESNIHFI